MRYVSLLSLTILTSCSTTSVTRSTAPSPSSASVFADPQSKAKVMLFGVFHFADAGLDAYKPKFTVNINSPARQAEVVDLVNRLAQFKPTKVAVEQQKARQPRIDSLYSAYLAGTYQLGTNEVYQLGFRLAKQLGHTRVYAIDAPPRAMISDSLARAGMQALGIANIDSAINADPWHQRYMSYYAENDSLKSVRTLREHLLEVNDPESVRRGHGHYLVASFKFAKDSNYVGPDEGTRWYNRNLRIFSNIQQITESPSERILAIIGSGHLPILRFLTETSPDHRLVEPAVYLGRK